MTAYVSLTIDEAVATITIDRETRHNSLIPPLLEELTDAVETADADDAVRVIRLVTAGTSFSTGGDVGAIADHRDELETYASELVGALNEALLAIYRSSTPTVVVVDGQVTGGSLGFILVSDVGLCAPAATITPYYPVVGFSPDGGWTALLPDIIGEPRTRYILTTNRTVSAAEAHAWGLISEVVADPHTRSHEVARTITDMIPGSLAQTNRLLGLTENELADRLEAERQAFVTQIQTTEALEGMQRFLEH